MAIAYIFVYIIRFGAEDWMIKYLSESKGNTLELAAMKLSSLPLVGIAGTICAGLISDKIFKGQRAPVNLIYLLGVVACLVLLKFNTISNIDFVLIGLLGAFTYGPQMMIGGLCAVESSSKKLPQPQPDLQELLDMSGRFYHQPAQVLWLINLAGTGLLYSG